MLRFSFLFVFALFFLSGVSAQNGNGNGHKATIVTAPPSTAIDDTWMVTTTDGVPTQSVRDQIRNHVNGRLREKHPDAVADGVSIEESILHNWESAAIYGFTVSFAAQSNKKGKIIPAQEKKIYHQLAVESLSELDHVLNIEQDSRVEAWGHPENAMRKPTKPVPPPPPPPPPPTGTSYPEPPVTETYSVGSSWGLDRIDSRTKTYDQKLGVPSNGAGVTAYVIDTGVRTTHEQFQKVGGGSRASFGVTFTGATDHSDGNGHGTHCAGTIGGKTTGIAHGVNIVAVQVLTASGSGSTSGCISGVNWVALNAKKPAVASMSLGGGFSSTFNSAIQKAVAAGIPFAIAAGNDAADACNYSPASAPDAITVGATTNGDAVSSFSNQGKCVDVFAPGSSIYSAWGTGDTLYNTISGTSMATPHVAGTIAVYLGVNPTATPAQVRQDLVCFASDGKLSLVTAGTLNKLLYTKIGFNTPTSVTKCYV